MAEGDIQHPHPQRAAPGSTQLRTVLLCDLADSTALVEKLGDRAASALMRRHDRIARDLIQQHGGREIDKTDGFLVLFVRPIQAVAFALDYQRALAAMEPDHPLRARVGIHVGEVQIWDNAAADIALGAKQVEVEGFAKPVAARLMALARPGQILLSGIAYTLAHRARDELDADGAQVRWLTHGRYRFKGVPQPMIVHEAGEAPIAPLQPPPSGNKVRRELAWYRTPVALTMELGIALAFAFGALYTVLQPAPAIAFAERDWVVVGDLRNLTSEPLFDDALDAAFRIGLEQTRFVNVVPELQVKNTLRRMDLDPQVGVDRERAIEIALREGARAVVLPTVAEIGGHVRVSVEVVDPHTGSTVYGESAQGRGREAALPAMDDVLVKLRSRLGESMASIEQSSVPLERVTTANLDALRAFSIGQRSLVSGAEPEGLALFERAIELDRDFALAYLRLGAYNLYAGNRSEALRLVSQAAIRRERLGPRDALYTDAYLAMFESPAEMREKWSLLARLYPDLQAGQQNAALVAYWYQNKLEDAASLFREITATSHPQRIYSWISLGHVLLAQGKPAKAQEAFLEARKLGGAETNFGIVDALAVLGRRADAEAELAKRSPALAFLAVEKLLRSVSFHLHHGETDAARIAADAAKDAAGEADLVQSAARAQFYLAVVEYAAGKSPKAQLLALVEQERARADRFAETRDGSPVVHLALAAVLAARADEPELARSALESAAPAIDRSGFPVRACLLAVARAELALATGTDAPQTSSQDPACFQQRVLAWRIAERAKEDPLPALTAIGRDAGLAFGEWNENFAGQALNVLDLASAAAAACLAEGTCENLRERWSGASAFRPRSRLPDAAGQQALH